MFALAFFSQNLLAQQQETTAKPEDTEVWSPVPAIVTPGATCGAAPSDAIVLFDGKKLDEWVSAQDHSPAQWDVHDGIVTLRGKLPRRSAVLRLERLLPTVDGVVGVQASSLRYRFDDTVGVTPKP